MTDCGADDVAIRSPRWFLVVELLFGDVVVVIEALYRGLRLNRPSDYRGMCVAEPKALIEAFRRREDFKEYERKRKEGYENRPVMKIPARCHLPMSPVAYPASFSTAVTVTSFGCGTV